jgi:pyruvate kinase
LKLKYISILILFLFSLNVKAQDPNEKGNLPHYYNQTLHFGFALGLNRANFSIDPSEHFERFDSLYKVEQGPKVGFNLGIISEVRLQKYLTLRFVPNLSFVERNIKYTFSGIDTTIVRIKTIESTFVNFPLDLKLRSKRVKNFGAYLLGGGAFALDLGSKAKVPLTTNPNPNEQIVKLKKSDFYYEVGSGAEFYMQYFKLALEVKLSMGTSNILKKENTVFSNAINKLNSKILMFSITFEG